jgi:hypothetical protein
VTESGKGGRGLKMSLIIAQERERERKRENESRANNSTTSGLKELIDVRRRVKGKGRSKLRYRCLRLFFGTYLILNSLLLNVGRMERFALQSRLRLISRWSPEVEEGELLGESVVMAFAQLVAESHDTGKSTDEREQIQEIRLVRSILIEEIDGEDGE